VELLSIPGVKDWCDLYQNMLWHSLLRSSIELGIL